MKKLAISLLACLACFQYTHAATSALTESLLEYNAITTAIGTNPSFDDIIAPNEFITDIERLTQEPDVLGTVKYEIRTTVLNDHRPRHRKVYIAKLNVDRNPGIGPNIITVISITKVSN